MLDNVRALDQHLHIIECSSGCRCVAGVIADMSLDIRDQVGHFKIKHMPHEVVMVRIGNHTGPVCAGRPCILSVNIWINWLKSKKILSNK